MRSIAIVSTKGGVTKTTTAANLGGILADLGQRVLLVDLDPQSTLSDYFEITDRAQYGVLNVVQTAELKGAVSRATFGVDVVVSDDVDNKLHDWIRNTPDGRARLKRALVNAPYDFVLIDTPGLAGPLQDVGALAADLMISPIPPDILSAREFGRGTIAMLERLEPMAALKCPLGPLFGLITRMDRTRDARIITEMMRQARFEASGANVRILSTVIPSRVCYREAATVQMPVHIHDCAPGRSSPSAREVMLQLVSELFPQLTELPLLSDQVKASA